MSIIEQLDRFVKGERELITAGPDDNVRDIAHKMAEKGVGCLMVLDKNGNLAGVVTEKDFLTKVIAKDKDPASLLVKDIMSTDVISCETSAPVYRAAEIMARRGIRHLPLTNKGKVVGMVSSRDIIAHEIAAVQRQAQQRYDAIRQQEQQA